MNDGELWKQYAEELELIYDFYSARRLESGSALNAQRGHGMHRNDFEEVIDIELAFLERRF